jgi:hypothetical protein
MQKIVLPSIKQIVEDFPQITFNESGDFYYSAKENSVFYNKSSLITEAGLFQLLHELGHATSRHHHFESGIELLKMESQAWHKAEQIAHQYDLKIPSGLIEHCIDSYRDWLHLRSRCPECGNIGAETEICNYSCFNCKQKWSVPLNQRSRCYRLKY